MTVTGRVNSNTKKRDFSNKSSTPKNKSLRLLDEEEEKDGLKPREPSQTRGSFKRKLNTAEADLDQTTVLCNMLLGSNSSKPTGPASRSRKTEQTSEGFSGNIKLSSNEV